MFHLLVFVCCFFWSLTYSIGVNAVQVHDARVDVSLYIVLAVLCL